MRSSIVLLVATFAIAMSGTASAAGCMTGAAVGGVAGHVAGHHALLGAAAGCAVGHHHAAKKQREARDEAHNAPAPQ